MKIALCLITVCLVMWLGSATPINPARRLINRPRIEEFGTREKRTPEGVKNGNKAPQRLEHRLRKGEFVCGDKICKLKAGVEPKGCDGICQYPVLPQHYPTKH